MAILFDLLFIVGVIVLLAGCWMLSLPLTFIVGGTILMSVGVIGATNDSSKPAG